MQRDIFSIRNEYNLSKLTDEDLPNNPNELFTAWFSEVLDNGVVESNAFFLSTVCNDGVPTTRTVLMKGFESGKIVFFTNYLSKKAQDIEHNNRVSCLFFWKELQRQVRIQGVASKTSRAVSEQYFSIRPFESRIGAIVSPQSQPISREELDNNFEKMLANKNNEIECPTHWGGYEIAPYYFEFWQGRANRLHDRITYTLQGNSWNIQRIAP